MIEDNKIVVDIVVKIAGESIENKKDMTVEIRIENSNSNSNNLNYCYYYCSSRTVVAVVDYKHNYFLHHFVVAEEYISN